MHLLLTRPNKSCILWQSFFFLSNFQIHCCAEIALFTKMLHVYITLVANYFLSLLFGNIGIFCQLLCIQIVSPQMVFV